MTVGVLGAGVMRPADLAAEQIPPAWRKATRNMMLAVKSMERALLQAPMLMERRRSGLGLIVGTNSGEIETSAEFITTLARSNMARPVLFQNSLHNATAGFASIHFGLTGPVFTLSDCERTPVEAVHLARVLLHEGLCSAVMITLVEVHKVMADYIGETLSEGACTLILGTPDFAFEMGAGCADARAIDRPYEVQAGQMPLFDITGSEFYRTAVRLSAAGG